MRGWVSPSPSLAMTREPELNLVSLNANLRSPLKVASVSSALFCWLKRLELARESLQISSEFVDQMDAGLLGSRLDEELKKLTSEQMKELFAILLERAWRAGKAN